MAARLFYGSPAKDVAVRGDLFVDIKAFQAQVRELSQHFDTTTPERRILYLISELGEVVDEVIELSTLSSDASDETIAEIKARIGLEIYDVIWNAVDLANQLDIDLEAAFETKITINKNRTWSRSGKIEPNDNS